MYCGILFLVIISDVGNFCLLFILMRFAKKLSVLLIFFKEPALDLADILLCLLSFSLVPYLSSLFFSLPLAYLATLFLICEKCG